MSEKVPFYTQPLIAMAQKDVRRLENVYNNAIDTCLNEHKDTVEAERDIATGEFEEMLDLKIPGTEPPLTISLNRTTLYSGERQRFAMLYTKGVDTAVATYISDSRGRGVARQCPDEPVKQAYKEEPGRVLDRAPLTGVRTDGLSVGAFEIRALAAAIQDGRV